MDAILSVYGLASEVRPEELAGGTVVVIDVLRASTTIVHALEAGAAQVIPCQEVDEARRAATQLPKGSAVLGGERGGLRIDGFDLGNSPTEYTPDRVAGRTVVFTTTNGTRAMPRCQMADRVLIGAFVNARAVCRQLAGAEQIHLLCAGTRGEPGRDDLLLAGLLVELLERQGGDNRQLNAQAETARQQWRLAFPDPNAEIEPERLADELRDSPGGRNLTVEGLAADILTAARIDLFDTVPELDPRTLRIRLP
jgi:2-phosphosulfolactate phosphatase